MNRTFLALMLALSLLLAGCGGSSKAEVSGTITPKPAATEAPVQTEAPATEAPVTMGRLEGGTYINEYAGFSCTLDSSWTYYSAEELQEMPANVKEILEGTELGDTLNPLTQFTDMMAENADLLTTMNVLYQKQSMEMRVAASMTSEEQLVDSVLEDQDQMIAAYAQAGIQVQSMEKVTVTFLGEQHWALKTVSTTQDVPYYILQLFDYDLGAYSVTLTLASFVEDKTADLLPLYAPVN